MQTSATHESGPRLLLVEHHEMLETLCRDLMAEVYSDNLRGLITRYGRFERAVLEHIRIEEQELLPAYTDHAIENARAIRTQHLELREHLFRLGVDLELHRARAERFELLIEALRRHIAFEEVTLYPWAQLNLPLHTKRELFVRVGYSIRELARMIRPGPAQRAS
jgi:hemerythrin-like domain-containing protein